jgi:hypothetical protein
MRVSCALVAVALLEVVFAGCRSPTGCRAGEPFCFCPAGASCTQTCSGPGCSLYCANGNASCALQGGDGCTASCQNARTCDVTCGKGSTVACQYVKTSCTTNVGDGSRVDCEGAALCDVTCTGACDVDCAGGHCRVHIPRGASCSLTGDGPVTCPDGVTRVNGLPCP